MLYSMRFNFLKKLICGLCLVGILFIFAPCLNVFAADNSLSVVSSYATLLFDASSYSDGQPVDGDPQEQYLYGYFDASGYSRLDITLPDNSQAGYYDVDISYEITLPFSWGKSSYNYASYLHYHDIFIRVYCPYMEFDLPDGLYVSYQGEYNTNTLSFSRDYSFSNKDFVLQSGYVNQKYTVHLYGSVYIDKKLSIPVTYRTKVRLSSVIASDNALNLVCIPTLSNTTSSYEYITSSDSVVGELNREHEEEKNEANKASSDLNNTLTSTTETLSAVEILKLPWTMLTDLYNAVSGTGEQTLTFPSFSLMGYKLWDVYVVSLSDMDSQYSVLFESVRLVSGFLICFAFGSYIRSYFVRLFAGDTEVD